LSDISVSKAVALFLTEKYDDAVTCWTALSSANPDNFAFLANRLTASIYTDEFDARAFDLCQQTLNDDTVTADILYALVPEYGAPEELKIRQSFLEIVCERQPDRVDAALALSDIYEQTQNAMLLKTLLDRLLSSFPKDERVLCRNALYALGNGNIGQSRYLYEKALRLNAPYTVCQYGFYVLWQILNKQKKIVRYAQEALKIVPDDDAVNDYLLEAYIRLRRLKDAGTLFEKMRADKRDMNDTVRFFWAETLSNAGKYDEAFDAAYDISPNAEEYGRLFFFLAKMLYKLNEKGEKDACEQRVSRWRKDFSADEAVAFTCAALSGKTGTPTPSPAFAEKVFDFMADDYEDTVVEKMKYKGVEKLAHMLKKAHIPAKKSFDIADLGCGTGLAGKVLKKYTGKHGRLTGVDVSQNMLDVAKGKRVYKKLVKNDLLSFMAGEKETYDLLVCLDVFGLFGDILPVLKAAHRALKKGGLFLFSVSQNTVSQEAYCLRPSGRYLHSVPYVEALLEDEGFLVMQEEDGALKKSVGTTMLDTVFLVQKNDG